MATATMTLNEIVQDSQDYGSNDEHMVSRVFFDLTIGGRNHSGLYVDVKQTVGTSYETAPLEVSHPTGYGGPMNHEALRGAVESCYRSQLGSAGRGIRLGPGCNVRMHNNRFRFRQQAQFEVNQDGAAW
ncbi:MAG: hypothetical protein JWO52_5901 [Gammaproteobacteria bacterium]|jgi:hypothetical protein|nr:hypothetical protein [Gammaproteobacteria bacterium]